MFVQTLGGIGLFLFGMILMTDGLKSMAGDALRGILGRFTGGTFSSLATGTALTAIVQSSSATTLATIGFVSAGLLTFPQAVGVIFGANLGTTSTSWIVSLLGLKLNIAAAALPLIGIGALLRLLGRGRLPAAGLALAGFGLIFVGIDTLQIGMTGLAERFDPSTFPQANLTGRLVLVLVGAVMTVVMQSSSAAAATTLTALSTGTIDLSQAAALVVGQNVGTTVTAGIASIGASTAAKRTALAHILFNLLTGLVAFLILPVFVSITDAIADAAQGVDAVSTGANDAVSLAAFHTAFNLLGVCLLLPFIHRFSAFVERIIPEKELGFARHLDRTVAHVAPVAIEAARRALREISAETLRATRMVIEKPTPEATQTLETNHQGLKEVRNFMSTISTSPDAPDEHARHLNTLHALDHIERWIGAAMETGPAAIARSDDALAESRAEVETIFAALAAWFENENSTAPTQTVMNASERLAEIRRADGPRTMEATASGAIQPRTALKRLEAIRWMDRIGFHSANTVANLAPPEPSAAGRPRVTGVYSGVDAAR